MLERLEDFLNHVERTQGEEAAFLMVFIAGMVFLAAYIFMCIITHGWFLLTIPAGIIYWFYKSFLSFKEKNKDA